MALQAVLSAFRQLVLDGIELPESVQARRELFLSRFSGLSIEEADDLAKMEPSRLAIYTMSVFSAEGNLLKNSFPLTLAAIEAAWPKEWGSYSPRSLAQRIHKAAPWRGIHSMALGESLISFLGVEGKGLKSPASWLLEAASLEQAMLEVRRAPNEPVPPQPEGGMEELRSLSVEELLAQEVLIPNLLRCVTVGHDLLPVRRALLEGEGLKEPAAGQEYLVGARPYDYGVLFVSVPEGIFAFLRECRGRAARLQEMAEVFVSTWHKPETSSDEEVFRSFLLLLRGLVAAGAVSLLARSPSSGR